MTGLRKGLLIRWVFRNRQNYFVGLLTVKLLNCLDENMLSYNTQIKKPEYFSDFHRKQTRPPTAVSKE